MAKFYSQISKESPIRAVKYYFAYGMNTNLSEMTLRCPKAIPLGPVYIRNYRLAFRTHADIEPAEGQLVHGALWSITEDCERSLDMLEGYPYYYTKRDFIVESDRPLGRHSNTRFVAMAYQMVDQDGYAPPGSRYLECLLEGYKDNGVVTDQIYQALEQANEHSITL